MKQGKSQSLAEILSIAIESRLATVHTCIPGRVIAYDKDSNLAEIQVEVRQFYPPDDVETELPPLVDVPIQWPAVSDSCYMTFPIKKGATGMIHFCERDFSNWLMDGGDQGPEEYRRFSISDSFFVPGIAPKGKMAKADDTDIVITNGSTEFRINPEGKFALKNGSEELVDLLLALMDELMAAKTVTSIGPQPFVVDTIAKMTALKSRMQKFKA